MDGSLRWRREIWWFVLPLALCPFVAMVDPGDAVTAVGRARQLLAWQRSVGVAIEPGMHAWVAARPIVEHAVGAFYLTAHLSALIATALWLAARRPEAYRRFRATFATAQLITIAVYLLWPVAPLRMVIGDTGDAGPEWTRSVQYEFAAMPSGHVVFALVVGLTLAQHAHGRWRWLGVVHPLLTAAAVMAMAHHLLLDAVAAAAIVGVAASTPRLSAVLAASCRIRTTAQVP